MPEVTENETGLVLVTHPGIATAVLQQARRIIGGSLPGLAMVEIEEPDMACQSTLAQAIENADRGQGVLILTDLPCATPSNMARKLASPRCRVISGLSLPMLIRAWNYRRQPLDELTRRALEGGRKAAIELD